MTEYEMMKMINESGMRPNIEDGLELSGHYRFEGATVVKIVNLAIADAEEKKKKARKKAKRFKRLYLEKCMECDTLLKQMSEMCSGNERGVKFIY